MLLKTQPQTIASLSDFNDFTQWNHCTLSGLIINHCPAHLHSGVIHSSLLSSPFREELKVSGHVSSASTKTIATLLCIQGTAEGKVRSEV